MRSSGRVIEVDALRGVAILGMLAVNVASPALRTAVPQLAHSTWHGVTLADLVFPVFLFVVGCAMAIGTAPTPGRIVRRTSLLFLLGLGLNLLDGVDVDTLRVMGVLQRIGLAYAVAALVMRRGGPSGWAVGAAALAGLHWVMLVWPVAGVSSLRPGGGLAAQLDRAVLGPAHTHLGRVPDPEGLLGTLGAAATILIGALAMTLLTQRRGPVLLGLGGVVAVAAGLGWAGVLPLNKTLWTGSYVLFTAGVTAVVLAGLTALRSIRAQQVLTPVAALGRNALTVSLVTEATRRLARRGPDGGVLASVQRAAGDLAGSAVGGGWLVVLLTVALAGAVAAVLARRGVTLRV